MSFITERDILDESKECFLTYAEEVLTDRSLPAAEDGLLSSQRKILWTMEDYLKMDAKAKTKKCNAVVGATLSTSYFHGDSSCYGVLCKLSQPYLMRYPLIRGQGSLGTQEDNSIVASSRYTECAPSIYTDLMMNDYKKNVVPTKETYNGEFMEPVFLPSLFPNALCNGRQAIGISMSHSSVPNNLREVCDAIMAYLEKGSLTIDEALTYIKGPDFPLENTIINKDAIRSAYATGRSSESFKVRGKYEIKGNCITFTTIPYRTYRNRIKEQFNKNIDEFDKIFDDFEDESNLGNNKLKFYVKKDVPVNLALNKLFALTDLQTSISCNMNFIVNGTPKMCSIVDLIKAYVNHQSNIIIKIAEFDRDKAQKRKHVIEGLLIAIKDIDTAIKLIRESDDKAEAKSKLINYFKITDIQADAILDMKLSKLTRLDKDELLDELKSMIAIIEESTRIIEDEPYRNTKISEKVKVMRDKYGDDRRTELTQITIEKEEKAIANIEPEKCIVVATEGGTIKRVPVVSYKAQKRNGKGIKTQNDITSMVLRTNTIDQLMIFSTKGQMYRLVVNDIPVGTNSSNGQSIRALVNMSNDEDFATMYSIYHNTDAKFVFFATKKGMVKKTTLDEYIKTKKKNGISAITLKDGDSIASVSLIKDEELIILTHNGFAIHVKSSDIAASSRTTIGVKGVNLSDDDYIIGVLPIRDKADKIAVFTTDGMGKKIDVSELPIQNRGGRGLKIAQTTIAGGALVNDGDYILVSGSKSSICISAADMPELKRASVGNTVIKNSNIMSITKV